MCKMESVQKYVRKSDYNFYQALVEVLIPDVLRPIPSKSLLLLQSSYSWKEVEIVDNKSSSCVAFSGSLTQAIRNFAKTLEGWLKNATTGVPEEMCKTKVARYFLTLLVCCELRRCDHPCLSPCGLFSRDDGNLLCFQLGAVSAFAQTLRRYTSLNHLAQAARAVLQNTSQINQMLTDLNRVDFANVQVR